MIGKFHKNKSSVENLLGTNRFHSCFRSDHRHWRIHSSYRFCCRYFHYRCSCHSCLQYLRFRLRFHFRCRCCLKTSSVRLGFNLRAWSCAVKKTSTSLTVSVQVSIAIAIVVQTVKISIAITYMLIKDINISSLHYPIWLLTKMFTYQCFHCRWCFRYHFHYFYFRCCCRWGFLCSLQVLPHRLSWWQAFKGKYTGSY